MNHTLRLAVGAVLLGALLGAAPPCRGEGRDWTVITLDSEGDAGRYADLQMGTDGKLHVLYLRSDTSRLKIITREGGVWDAPQTIDTSGSVTGYCALATAPGGDLPVSYRRSSSGELWYAGPQQAQQWSTAQITAETDDVGRGLAVLQETSGDLALSFRNQTDGSLLHMRRESGSWTPIETVDPGPNRGQYGDLAHRPGVGYAFSEYAADGGFLAYADPEIEPQAWTVQPVTSEADDVGRGLSIVRQGGMDLALSFCNQTDGSLLHMRREGGSWTPIETVDPGPSRGQYADLAYRPAVGYAFSEYAADGGFLAFADPAIEAQPWRVRALDHYNDVGRQISMIKGPEGRLNYTYLGYDMNSGWHIRAGEYMPDSVRILRTVDTAVASSGTDHVYPDIFLTPGENWFLSYRNAVDHHLYSAWAETLQILSSDVAAPGPSDPSVPIETRLLGARPNPAAGGLRIDYSAAATEPVELQLIDPAGRVVRSREATSQPGTNSIDLEASSPGAGRIPAGVYFVKLRVGQTWLGPQRLVLVR